MTQVWYSPIVDAIYLYRKNVDWVLIDENGAMSFAEGYHTKESIYLGVL